MTEQRVIVSEVFGPTVQGEGPSAGQRCAFVRLGRCNLDCHWCDTSYTWDWSGKNGVKYDPAVELTSMTVTDIVERVYKMNVPLVVISGGEPLIQVRALDELVPALMGVANRVEIETNGTRQPLTYRPLRYNVSPKLSGSGVSRDRAWNPDAIGALEHEDSVFKFVITDFDVDVAEVLEFVEMFDVPRERVWLMPEGVTADKINASIARVADAAIEHGWNVTTRLHTLAWGKERGH